MPNWCLNHITVSHSDRNMMEKFVAAYNNGKVCEYFIPQPPNISNEDCFANDGWYTWRLKNWGTKWDFGKDEYGDPATLKEVEYSSGKVYESTLSVDTAWSPPIEFYDKLVELGYDVHASYFEPGMTYCGIYHNGVDNCIDYHGEKDLIPVAIWNEYNLDEFFSD